MFQGPNYVRSPRSDAPRSHRWDEMQSSHPLTGLQEEAVEDITTNIMAILESKIRSALDEMAPQVRSAVRQALDSRDRAVSRSTASPIESTQVGYTPPTPLTVSNDMPQGSLVPGDPTMTESASRGRNTAVAVVCSPKPRSSACHTQLAQSLTEHDRPHRRSNSLTTATSSSNIASQSTRSVTVIEIHGSDESDIPASASRADSESDRDEGQVQVSTAPSRHHQPTGSSSSTAYHRGGPAGNSREVARTCALSASRSRKRTREDEEPIFLKLDECPLREIPRGKR